MTRLFCIPIANDRASAAGFDRHLVKPIDGAALRKLLAEVSDRLGPEAA